jgi:ribosomal protein S18 acetylase RimI-like enzyme
VIRPLRLSDRGAIASILERTGVFSRDELDCALSLVDETFADPDQPDPYRFVIAADAGDDTRVLGYACFGTTPLTKGTCDLYWIAVDPALHGGGVGRALLEEVERSLRADGQHQLVIETSSRADYEPTRAFYLRVGCVEEARVRDFYARGDDKVFYVKRLASG